MTAPRSGCVATVGTFDGLHRGHMAIVDAVLRRAAQCGMAARVITFSKHPLATIAPERCPQQLMERTEVVRRLESTGIASVEQLDFTPETASLTAAQFLDVLRHKYGVRHLVMGFDNSFGSDRLRGREAYCTAAAACGIDIEFVEPVLTADGRKISSSLLRQAYADGDIELIRECTGHVPTLQGTVRHGLQNGRKLGFPTLNIAPSHPLPLRCGVYQANLVLPQCTLRGVLNIGHNPTIADGNPRTYELHIPGHDLGDMYGSNVTVQIVRYLRPERKFGSLGELKQAIAQDIKSIG